MNRILVVSLVASALVLVGCASGNDQSKREQDRLAMQLADAQRAQNESAAQTAALRSQLEAAQQSLSKAEQDLAAVRQTHGGELTDAKKQLAAARAELERAQQELAAARKANEDLHRSMTEMNRKLEATAASARQPAATAPPTTQPELNK